MLILKKEVQIFTFSHDDISFRLIRDSDGDIYIPLDDFYNCGINYTHLYYQRKLKNIFRLTAGLEKNIKAATLPRVKDWLRTLRGGHKERARTLLNALQEGEMSLAGSAETQATKAAEFLSKEVIENEANKLGALMHDAMVVSKRLNAFLKDSPLRMMNSFPADT